MFKRMTIRTRVALLATLVLVIICFCITLVIINISVKELIYVSTPQLNPQEQPQDDAEHIVMMSLEGNEIGQELLKKSLPIMLIFTLIGGLSVWILTKRALYPIIKLSNNIVSINENDLNTQLPEPIARDEVAELTKSFNQMLVKINSSFETQKRFSAMSAHELKTPLTAIIANLETLNLGEEPSNEEYADTMMYISESANRMEKLIKDLLAAHSGNNAGEYVVCDVRMICEHIGEACQISYDNDVSFGIDGKLLVNGDSILLERAVSNLIENAFRYNKKGGNVRVILQDNTLIVKDTGIGIPEEALEKIWEPFFRVDESRSRKLGGSGLGLSIAKSIFEAHAAEVEIKSELESGTEITVRFDIA